MVLFSEDPSTGQNMPQNFCRGLGLPEPRFLKKAGTSSSSAAFPDCFLSAMARGLGDRPLCPSVRPSSRGSPRLPVRGHEPLAARKVHRKEAGLASGDPPWRSLPLTPLSPLPAHAPRGSSASWGERQSWVWESGRCGSPSREGRGGAGLGAGTEGEGDPALRK